MKTLRTPDSCFDDLHEYPFAPNYVDIPDSEGGKLRVHYVDEGSKDAPPVVMIHGNPTWSYMWRKVIPAVVAAGYRAIAIDMVGMGRSDKPSEMSDYSIARHVEWLRCALFDELDLTNIRFVLHDWGAIMGVRLTAIDMDRVDGIVFSNSGIPVRDPSAPIAKMSRGMTFLRAFQLYVRWSRGWKHWNLLERTTVKKLPSAVVRGFAAPYPSKEYLTCNRQFTQLLPTRNDNAQLVDNWHAMQTLTKFDKPFLCLFSDKDIVAPKGHRYLRKVIPGAAKTEPIILKGGSHFLLEDVPEEYVVELLAWLRAAA